MTTDLYQNFQPITWRIGIIDAGPDEVVRAIEPVYAISHQLQDIQHRNGSIDEMLKGIEPLGPADKILIVETTNGRSVMFCNSFIDGMVLLPTWTAGETLGVNAYYVRNVPNTISRDHRSGNYGARTVEFRSPQDPYGKEPTFGIV